MKFRKQLFTLFAWLAFAWLVFGLFYYTNYYTEETVGASELQSSAVGLGSSIGYVLWFFCPSLFGVLLFAYIAHRNGRGLKEEQRHRELIEAQKRHNG